MNGFWAVILPTLGVQVCIKGLRIRVWHLRTSSGALGYGLGFKDYSVVEA